MRLPSSKVLVRTDGTGIHLMHHLSLPLGQTDPSTEAKRGIPHSRFQHKHTDPTSQSSVSCGFPVSRLFS